MPGSFLPVTPEEVAQRGWDAPDFVYAVGEAYVDHPSFGHAIIGRVLEAAGYRVAMLCLPEYHSAEAFKRFGRPKLGFLVSSGVIDSMVNHYTVARKRRNTDVYAPGGRAGLRPDRAVTVYCNRIHEAYPGIPVLIGGVEASLRRFSHYDYWDNKVRRSVLVDSAATLLLYGMGENTILDCCDWVRRGMPAHELPRLRGVCYMAKQPPRDALLLPSHAEIAADKRAYCRAFLLEYQEQDPVRGHTLCQQQDAQRYLVQNPPALPLTRQELDRVYDLPFTRLAHPMYDAQGGVPALQEVRFSISAVRGCFGACSFCALTFHQGRIVSSRSEESLLKEARLLASFPDFKGYIHDVGGPTANFRQPACDRQLREGACKNRQCLYPTPCKHMRVSHTELVSLLRKMRAIPGVKKVFIRSGIRYDYLMADKSDAVSDRAVPLSCERPAEGRAGAYQPECARPHGQATARGLRGVCGALQRRQPEVRPEPVSGALPDEQPSGQHAARMRWSWRSICAIRAISRSRCRISIPRPGTLEHLHVLHRPGPARHAAGLRAQESP